MDRLSEILESMDVPAMRRNIANNENIRWLLRNIHVNNANNPNLNEAIRLLKQEATQIVGE